jgi:hypothetical protein
MCVEIENAEVNAKVSQAMMRCLGEIEPRCLWVWVHVDSRVIPLGGLLTVWQVSPGNKTHASTNLVGNMLCCAVTCPAVPRCAVLLQGDCG